ncbi:hypothetical protein ABEG63_15865 [Chryseobacterium sp. C39-AII1]|uniref:hypothetical protein n=1 Tax=Chryseobacterium sp. C39-AII1 TaxID=3080332 RepID=UPI00320A64BF
MIKQFTLLLILICISVKSQIRYDTISFDKIKLNNTISLYTDFNYLKKIIDDKETHAKVYTGKDIQIPFVAFDDDDIIYTVFSNNLVFNYKEENPNKIYISYIKTNKNLTIQLKLDEKKYITLNNNMALVMLKKYFKNSALAFAKNGKIFRLIIRKENKYAYCDLIFRNKKFVEMYLIQK